MIFAIRDDDTSFYTQPCELVSAYNGMENIPISLSVVPYASITHGNVEPYGVSVRQDSIVNPPVHKNRELVKFIVEHKNKYEVLLHGIHHNYLHKGEEWIPEMLFLPESEIRKELPKAKRYLESVFECEISTFIAPSDWMDAKAFRVIDEMGMNTMCLLSKVIDHPVSIAYLFYYIERNLYRLFGQKKVGVRKYKNHKELDCFPLVSEEEMWSKYLLCKKYECPYVLYTHYWELNQHPEKKNALLRIVERMQNDGAEGVFVSSCFRN